MAFTDTQKDQIRQYLGYPAAFRDQNYQLESMMDTVGANAIEQASVEAILTELATIDTALASSGSSTASYGALKQVDEVQFYDISDASSTGTVDTLARGKMLIARLARRFGIQPLADYFSAETPMLFAFNLG